MYYRTARPSPLGMLTLVGDENHLMGLWMEGQKYFGGKLLSEAAERENLAVFGAVGEWLDRYFAGERPDVSVLPLAPSGTDFQKEVWRLLGEIPCGEVASYGEIAAKLAQKRGAPMSARAVGSAASRNPISILIPCHRLVGAEGRLTGYAGGLERKIFLLRLEGAKVFC